MSKNVRYMITVMEAYANGATVQYYDNNLKEWLETSNPLWSWDDLEYRVMPSAPKAVWVNFNSKKETVEAFRSKQEAEDALKSDEETFMFTRFTQL